VELLFIKRRLGGRIGEGLYQAANLGGCELGLAQGPDGLSKAPPELLPTKLQGSRAANGPDELVSAEGARVRLR